MLKIPVPPREYYRLFIDESGTASPLDTVSSVYILSGCSLKKSDCYDLKISADHIKFKYWNKTDIVFHSRELGRREGDFSIFKDEKLFGNFLLKLLTTDSRGEMIIESATAEKDIYLLQALAYFLAAGLEKPKVSYNVVKDTLTSVSFVTKQNNDIEEQISDLFGYGAKLTYMKELKQAVPKLPYENMILRVFNRSIYKVPTSAGPKKARFFNEVKPFLVIP